MCGKQEVTLEVNTDEFTLEQLFTLVLQRHMGFNEPYLDVANRGYSSFRCSTAQSVYSSFIGFGSNAIGVKEDCSAEKLKRPLSAPGVKIDNGALLLVIDESQDLKCSVHVVHRFLPSLFCLVL